MTIRMIDSVVSRRTIHGLEREIFVSLLGMEPKRMIVESRSGPVLAQQILSVRFGLSLQSLLRKVLVPGDPTGLRIIRLLNHAIRSITSAGSIEHFSRAFVGNPRNGNHVDLLSTYFLHRIIGQVAG